MVQKSQRFTLSLIALGILLLGICYNSPLDAINPDVSNPNIPSSSLVPLAINGNAELLTAKTANSWTGTGAAGDPIKIKDVVFSDNFGVGTILLIANTTLDVEIINCSISGGANGLILNNVTHLKVINSSIMENNGTALDISKSSVVSLSGNKIVNSIGGLTISNCENITVKFTEISDINNNTGTVGLGIEESKNLIIESVEIFEISHSSIQLRACDNVTVENSQLYRGLRGLNLIEVNNSKLIHNDIHNITEEGIKLESSLNNIVYRNNVYGAGTVGIDIRGTSSGNNVTMNNFIFNGANGKNNAGDSSGSNIWASNFYSHHLSNTSLTIQTNGVDNSPVSSPYDLGYTYPNYLTTISSSSSTTSSTENEDSKIDGFPPVFMFVLSLGVLFITIIKKTNN
jgi:parallel beta-helix repeat protein